MYAIAVFPGVFPYIWWGFDFYLSIKSSIVIIFKSYCFNMDSNDQIRFELVKYLPSYNQEYTTANYSITCQSLTIE